jgi:hypothetical protein
MSEEITVTRDMVEGFCVASPDFQHCEHWWDEVPCCFCGMEGEQEGEIFTLKLGKGSIFVKLEDSNETD